jgi:hypothetical protein
MSRLLACKCHETLPALYRVGDQKEYFVYMCPKCFKTPVRHNEARLTEFGARMIWNVRVTDG